MKKILIVEDDKAIAEIERDFLEINGFETAIVRDGLEGLKYAFSGDYDLILLDLMLPNIDGYEVCKKMRERIDIPIIIVTAKSEDVDKIRGLGMGADDYVTNPFSPTELVARVKANLAQYERLTSGQRSHSAENQEIQIDNIRVNPKTHRVYVDGRETKLKNKEYELLLFLITNPDVIFNKEFLYEKIWGMETYRDIKTVAVHINRLREKIEKDPANPVHIQTEWGVGYRFKI